ncbi:MAG TPA: hypothetical protein VGN11_10750 [Candidatus Baltobacteraceae bacterium]|nr:hypothetical protein [Candidatus Baltobacteraceae bacterium]
MSLTESDFRAYLRRLIDGQFPDGGVHDMKAAIDAALVRTERCFSAITLPAYARDGEPYLSHLHGDQFAVFLYYLSNAAYRNGDRMLAEKAMLLNKARNGIVVTYDTELPEHLLLIHTVGTVLGKATYGDFFVATQNVTVGTHRGAAPVFGAGVILYPHAFVAGRCTFGDHTRVAAGAVVLDLQCAPGSVVSGAHPNVSIHSSARHSLGDYFKTAD